MKKTAIFNFALKPISARYCGYYPKFGFRIPVPTLVNIYVNLYLVWKVVENVHFYVNFFQQIKSWPDIKRSDNSQQFWIKLSTWIPLVTEVKTQSFLFLFLFRAGVSSIEKIIAKISISWMFNVLKIYKNV